MIISRVFRIRNLAVLILVLILTASTYAFAATNTVSQSRAGEGSGSINPYTISNIRYTLDTDNPTQIRSLQLDTSPTGGASAPSEVQVRIDTGAWVNCSGGPTTWTCAFSAPYPTVRVVPATTLQVVAAQ